MTVVEADISSFSKYSVSDEEGATFTSAMFDDYAAKAIPILTAMGADNLDADLYDICHALMICHLHTAKEGIVEVESTTDPSRWKWSKPGDTTFKQQIREILADNKKNATHTGAPATISRNSSVVKYGDVTEKFTARQWRGGF